MKFSKYSKHFNNKLNKILNLSIIINCSNYHAKSKTSKSENYNNNYNNSILQKYKQLTLIQSYNSNIYKAYDTDLYKYVIIKEMIKDIHIIEHEYNMLNKLDHNNIIKAYSKIDNMLILDYINGIDMFDFILQNNKFIKFDTILSIAKQLSNVFMYLKTQNLIHCDVKPENIMITKEIINNKSNTEKLTKTFKYNVKLIDFGSAIINNTYLTNNNQKNNIPINIIHNPEVINNYYIIQNYYTPQYSPPERLKYNIVSEGTDVWALGCIFYILVTKQHPFDLHGVSDIKKINDNILNNEVKFNQTIWKIIPIEFQNMIKRMLEKDPNKRISIEEIYNICNNL